MPSVNPKCLHLSTSCISTFKRCPTAFRLAYREGIRTAQDTDSQRQGTNWHSMHECYAKRLAEHGPDCGGTAEEYAMSGVVHLLNERYTNRPLSKTAEEWEVERQVLLMSFVAYQWYWANDPVEVLASEVPFNLPVHLPDTGLPLPMSEVQRVGKIDHIIHWHGMVGVLERKSTSRAIGPDSDYWDRSRKDTQVSMYALAFQDMIASGALAHLDPLPLAEGVPMPNIGATLYDVWHKPTIKPKMLTQADTAAFIESHTYFDQTFEVVGQVLCNGATTVTVDGDLAEVEIGKKGFAIRETPRMFGARLLADIQERPDFYFQRREIARTDAEVRKFRRELFAHYQNMKLVEKHNTWTENEASCDSPFRCAYKPICYGPGADAVCDGRTTPDGFKRIFVDLTKEGQSIAEEE